MIGSCVMVSTAKSLPVLVLARAVQGLTAAVAWVIGPAFLTERAGEQEAGRGMGFVSLAVCLSLALSPVLSGLLYR